jgi:glycosyltransferase involved in cell wall biosynthesis
MRVALYTPFVVQQNTGIARYTLGLLRALAAANGAHGNNEYICFWPPQAPWPADLPLNFFAEPIRATQSHPIRRILSEHQQIQAAYRRRPFDVLHAPFGYLPLRSPTPTVLTVPDVRVLRYPQTFSRLRGGFLRWAIPRSVRAATRTLAMSEATRGELLDTIAGADARRVRVSYPGLDRRWFTPPPAAALADTRARIGRENGDEGRFVLAVSTWEPHKNLPRLLQAVARLRSEDGMDDLRLALAGATFASGKSDALGDEIQRLGLARATQVLGIVPDALLPAVYASADVFCFPSLYEGFGYPPLEAMAVGTPVVTSQASCLPEVAGKAAELVDPLSAEKIAAGLRRVLTDDARRRALVEAGRERAAQFRWERHAGEVIAAYQEAVAENNAISRRDGR